MRQKEEHAGGGKGRFCVAGGQMQIDDINLAIAVAVYVTEDFQDDLALFRHKQERLPVFQN